MFGTDLDPGVLPNPSAFTYAIHLVLRADYGVLGLVDGRRNVVRDCRSDLSGVYLTGRVLAAVLCMLSVMAVYAVGRRLWSAAGGWRPPRCSRSRFSQSHIAVRTDRRGCAFAGDDRGIRRGKGTRHRSGYGTSPWAGRPWVWPSGLSTRQVCWWHRWLAASLVTGAQADGDCSAWRRRPPPGSFAFVVTNPFFVLRLGDTVDQLRAQAVTAHRPKLGQRNEYAAPLYLRSLTWGLGWGVPLAAAAGALSELRRSRSRAIVLLVFPLLLFAFLSMAERFFARSLMPAFPVLALLAGVGTRWFRLTPLLAARRAARGGWPRCSRAFSRSR